jgi:hypothetical protein
VILTCNRIIFPPVIEDEDEVIRESKMRQAAKNIRKRRMTFHLGDIEKFSEHEDTRFVMVWFYYSEPVVLEYSFDELNKLYIDYNESNEEDDEHTMRFWIPAN